MKEDSTKEMLSFLLAEQEDTENWQVEAERAVRCMEKNLHHCLHYYAFLQELWKEIRTTNMLE